MKLEAWPGVLGSPVSWDVHAWGRLGPTLGSQFWSINSKKGICYICKNHAWTPGAFFLWRDRNEKQPKPRG